MPSFTKGHNEDFCPHVEYHASLHVRAIQDGAPVTEAILDSGSDMTVLPPLYQQIGVEEGDAPVLRDAQGNVLKATKLRKVELLFTATTGETIKFKEMATIANNVRQPLLSAAKFLKNGWTPTRDKYGHLHLKHDRDGYAIPLRYSGNSLAMSVRIRRVDQEQAQGQDQQVREICQVPKAGPDEWHFINGAPTCMTTTDRYVDARERFSEREYPYRTTMALLSEEEKSRMNKDWTPETKIWDIFWNVESSMQLKTSCWSPMQRFQNCADQQCDSIGWQVSLGRG